VSRPIIEVRNLSKKYRLGAIGATSIREHASRVWDRVRGVPHPDPQEYWALRDVSFDIQPGEVVGVIGRNGAGKSTLLKILSRITEPTSGTARIRGRVASLLEVGTGFHPELTGRENVYLNGAILGMTRAEVKSKFDEIVAFAEIDQFIDTPVKRYSSGMYVRLAFAVAAHLEPEILIVDEVLAVGDSQFQQKCLGRMKTISSSHGRTVLFVSHNNAAIRNLTNSCLLLEKGEVANHGRTSTAIDQYLRSGSRDNLVGKGLHTRIVAATIVDNDGNRVTEPQPDQGLNIEMTLELSGKAGCSIECTLTDLEGTRLGLYSPGHFRDWRLPTRPGLTRLRIPMALPPLATGRYGFDISTTLHGFGPDHYIPEAVIFAISTNSSLSKKWELRKEYNAGYLVIDSGEPVEIRDKVS
jgi:lipopolysaccharide transport system ATP-binding protein